jgi:hypothetical protein
MPRKITLGAVLEISPTLTIPMGRRSFSRFARSREASDVDALVRALRLAPTPTPYARAKDGLELWVEVGQRPKVCPTEDRFVSDLFAAFVAGTEHPAAVPLGTAFFRRAHGDLLRSNAVRHGRLSPRPGDVARVIAELLRRPVGGGDMLRSKLNAVADNQRPYVRWLVREGPDIRRGNGRDNFHPHTFDRRRAGLHRLVGEQQLDKIANLQRFAFLARRDEVAVGGFRVSFLGVLEPPAFAIVRHLRSLVRPVATTRRTPGIQQC